METNNKHALKRIIEKTGLENVLEILSEELSLSDLNSLLLEVYKNKASDMSPVELLNRYSSNRFVQPATANLIELKQAELDLLKLAESLSYSSILLSPVAPFGSCSAIATVDQNKVISALRGTEVVADSTNLLALHICEKLKKGELNNNSELLRYCSSHRLTRAQSFSKPGLIPHFNVFCMVTSGKDKGSYSFEKEAVVEHFDMYKSILKKVFHTDLTFRFIGSKGYKDNEGLIHSLKEYLHETRPNLAIENEVEKTDNLYYQGFQFKVIIRVDEKEVHIGDGGIVDWSQKLLANKKERMLISAIGLDRLLEIKQ